MKKNTASVIVKRSSAGLGLFATKEFKRGDFIIEYTGKLLTDAEADKRGGKYLFIVKEDVVIDGTGRENTARYINHGCKPNAEAERDEDELKIRILAKKKILPGDEITYDYGIEYCDEFVFKHGCRCASCVAKK